MRNITNSTTSEQVKAQEVQNLDVGVASSQGYGQPDLEHCPAAEVIVSTVTVDVTVYVTADPPTDDGYDPITRTYWLEEPDCSETAGYNHQQLKPPEGYRGDQGYGPKKYSDSYNNADEYEAKTAPHEILSPFLAPPNSTRRAAEHDMSITFRPALPLDIPTPNIFGRAQTSVVDDLSRTFRSALPLDIPTSVVKESAQTTSAKRPKAFAPVQSKAGTRQRAGDRGKGAAKAATASAAAATKKGAPVSRKPQKPSRTALVEREAIASRARKPEESYPAAARETGSSGLRARARENPPQ